MEVEWECRERCRKTRRFVKRNMDEEDRQTSSNARAGVCGEKVAGVKVAGS